MSPDLVKLPITNLKILGFKRRSGDNEFVFKTKQINKKLRKKVEFFYGPYQHQSQFVPPDFGIKENTLCNLNSK